MSSTKSTSDLKLELKHISENILLTCEIMDMVNELMDLRDEQMKLIESHEKQLQLKILNILMSKMWIK